MKLYYAKGACSLAPHIIINELDLACDYESVNLKMKQTETGSDFLKINPKGYVPTLITNSGETLTEAAVILQYLADSSHATQLLPAIGNFDRYHVLEWITYISSELHKSMSQLFNAAISEEMKEKIFVPMIKTKLKFVDHHLHRHTYLMGDHFTLPDAYLFVILRWAHHFKFDLAKWPRLFRYFAELHERPSVQLSLKEEGIQIK